MPKESAQGLNVMTLLFSEGRDLYPRIFAAATLAGMANALILALINIAIEHSGALNLGPFLGLAAASIVYVLGARYSYSGVTGIFETALHKTKLRLIEKIEQADLEQLDGIGRAVVREQLMSNAGIVSEAAGAVAAFLQCICVLIATSLYIAWLSWLAFLLLLLVCLGLRAWYRSRAERLRDSLSQLATYRVAFFDALSDLLRGFKTVKLSPALSRDLAADIDGLSGSLGKSNQQFFHVFNDNWIALESWRCLLIGAVVFVVPLHATMDSIELHKLVAALLFFFYPLSSNVLNIPSYVRVNEALTQLQNLEARLDAARSPQVAELHAFPGPLQTLEAQGLMFSYGARTGESEFRIGPIDLTITAGSVVFIVGGNGSGKSTLLKLLTGLYRPTAGTLRVNGRAVGPEHVLPYRELFSAVFSDFHLFEQLYGLAHVGDETVRQLLRELRLEGKVSLRSNDKIPRNLSTGQRKRVAMLVAMLEDRPIYVFDEWAADQDPEFRRYFYEDVLSKLRTAGKAVIVVSHDDQYFHCADTLWTMEYGVLRSVHPDSQAGEVRPGTDAD